MAKLISILLQKNDSSIHWGFRLESPGIPGYPLVVSRVTPGSIGSQYLEAGDVVISIQDYQTIKITLDQAEGLIQEAGNALKLVIHKRPSGGTSPGFRPVSMVPTPPTPSQDFGGRSPLWADNRFTNSNASPCTPNVNKGPFFTPSPVSPGSRIAPSTPDVNHSPFFADKRPVGSPISQMSPRTPDVNRGPFFGPGPVSPSSKVSAATPEFNRGPLFGPTPASPSPQITQGTPEGTRHPLFSPGSVSPGKVSPCTPDANRGPLFGPASSNSRISPSTPEVNHDPVLHNQTSGDRGAPSTPAVGSMPWATGGPRAPGPPSLTRQPSSGGGTLPAPPPPPPPASLPPPPPPPPPPPGSAGPTWREKQQMAKHNSSSYDPSQHSSATPEDGANKPFSYLPPALHGTLTMSKDKKPFTYTPGGIDLNQIRSPRMQKRLIANQQAGDEALPQQPQSQQNSVPMPPPQQPYCNAQTNHSYNSQPPKAKQQAYVLPAYNSPLNLYSQQNALDAYQQQTGEPARQMEGLNLADGYGSPAPTGSLPRNSGVQYENDYQGQPRNFGQSRSFRILQKITDTDGQPEEPEKFSPRRQPEEDEMRFTGFRQAPIPSKAFHTLQRVTAADNAPSPPPFHENNEYCDHPEQWDEEMIEPRYKGGNIPCRSFRMLQEMTGASDEDVPATPPSAPQKPRKTSKIFMQVGNPSTPSPPPMRQFPHPQVPASQQPAEAEPRMYTGGHIPSRSFRMLQAMTGENTDSGGEGTDF